MTRTRGLPDTPRSTWGVGPTGLRPLGVALLVALVVHLIPPLAPPGAIGWLTVLLRGEDVEERDVPEQEATIPIELDMFAREPASPPPPTPAAKPTEAPVPAPAAPRVVAAPDPVDDEPDPAVDDLEDDPPRPVDPPAKPEKKVAERKLRLEGALDASKDTAVAHAEHPNVNIYIAAAELRKRDQAAMFGELLEVIPQWKRLIGGTKLDPIKDFDHVLISAPHMRKQARWIVARVGYNAPTPKMKTAIGEAAKRSRGAWLEGYELPVASLDKGTRRVVLIEDKKQLVILPEDAEDQIDNLKNVGAFPKNPAAGIYVDMLSPANAFKSKFPMPKSIEKMTVRFSLAADGGYLVEAELIDASEQSAKDNAKLLEDELEELRPIPVVSFFSKKYFFGKPVFEVEGEVIRMKASLTRDQLERIMGLVKLWLESKEEAAAAKKKNRRPRARPIDERQPKPPGVIDALRKRVNSKSAEEQAR